MIIIVIMIYVPWIVVTLVDDVLPSEQLKLTIKTIFHLVTMIIAFTNLTIEITILMTLEHKMIMIFL